ncbi:MAG: hypothetical protein LC749_09180 [Actinobacteria bacterium]|nr:hypothetical protein [Actinomycetota bacterium]
MKTAKHRAPSSVNQAAGLRLSELAVLDMADVQMSARRGRLKVRTGK